MKKITLAIVLICVWGIIGIAFPTSDITAYLRLTRLDYIQPFGLKMSPFPGWWEYYIGLNVMLNVFMICAALLYYFTKGRETRLLRFLLALVLYSKAIGSLSSILFMLLADEYNLLLTILFLVIQIGFVFAAYRILIYLNHKKELALTTPFDPELIPATFVQASGGQRFLNLLFDGLIAYMSISPLISVLTYERPIRDALNSMSDLIGPWPSVILLISLYRIAYYLLFEILFHASPAKFLTETRVVQDDGEPLKTGNVIARTLYRFVPFDAISFVFAHTGWHDAWSGTSVVKEKRTGIKGSRYFLILPFLIILYILGYFGMEYARIYSYQQSLRNAFEEKAEEHKKKIDRLDDNDIIELYSSDNYNTIIYLKPEKISGNKIQSALITFNNSYEYSPDQETIEDFYLRYQQYWKKVQLDRKMLFSAIGEYDELSYNNHKAKLAEAEGVSVPGIDGKFIIKSIRRYFQPNIELTNIMRLAAGRVSFELTNMAWNGTITSINTIKGGMVWDNSLPKEVTRKNTYKNNLIGESKEEIEDFEFNITVNDTLGRTQLYKMSGNVVQNKLKTELIK